MKTDSSTPADDAFRTATWYCFSPLQSLSFAERALIFVDPYENWALLFVRSGASSSVYSTRHQEGERRRRGQNYSINSLESAIGKAPSLKGALEWLDDTKLHTMHSGSAQEIGSFEGMAWVADEIFSMAGMRGSHSHLSEADREEVETRLRAYVLELFSEHLGVDLGLTFLSSKTEDLPAGREVAASNAAPEIKLKPLKGTSIYSRKQRQLNL